MQRQRWCMILMAVWASVGYGPWTGGETNAVYVYVDLQKAELDDILNQALESPQTVDRAYARLDLVSAEFRFSVGLMRELLLGHSSAWLSTDSGRGAACEELDRLTLRTLRSALVFRMASFRVNVLDEIMVDYLYDKAASAAIMNPVEQIAVARQRLQAEGPLPSYVSPVRGGNEKGTWRTEVVVPGCIRESITWTQKLTAQGRLCLPTQRVSEKLGDNAYVVGRDMPRERPADMENWLWDAIQKRRMELEGRNDAGGMVPRNGARGMVPGDF